MPYLKPDDFDKVLAAIGAGVGMCDSALPQFDWGKSALDGDAIQSLNETPGELKAALKLLTDAKDNVVEPGLRALAVELFGDDECEIDDEGAGISPTDDGTWVQAWVWVSREEMIDHGLIPEDKCRTEGCDGDPDDGEGEDGYCGNCADAIANDKADQKHEAQMMDLTPEAEPDTP